MKIYPEIIKQWKCYLREVLRPCKVLDQNSGTDLFAAFIAGASVGIRIIKQVELTDEMLKEFTQRIRREAEQQVGRSMIGLPYTYPGSEED